jgi:hypothetical protein
MKATQMTKMRTAAKDSKRKNNKLVCLETPRKVRINSRETFIKIGKITQSTGNSRVNHGFWLRKIDKENKEKKLLGTPSLVEERGLQSSDYYNFFVV